MNERGGSCVCRIHPTNASGSARTEPYVWSKKERSNISSFRGLGSGITLLSEVATGASFSCVERCTCPQQDTVLEGAKGKGAVQLKIKEGGREEGRKLEGGMVEGEGGKVWATRPKGEGELKKIMHTLLRTGLSLFRAALHSRGYSGEKDANEARSSKDDCVKTIDKWVQRAVQRGACESVIEDALKDVAKGLKGEREWRSAPFLEWFAKFVKGCAKEAAKKKRLEAGAPSAEEDLALRAACRLRFGEVRPNVTFVRLKKLSEDRWESLAEVEEASRLKEIGAVGGDGKVVFVDEIAPGRFEFLIARSSVACQPLSLSKRKASAQGEGRMLPCKRD